MFSRLVCTFDSEKEIKKMQEPDYGKALIVRSRGDKMMRPEHAEKLSKARYGEEEAEKHIVDFGNEFTYHTSSVFDSREGISGVEKFLDDIGFDFIPKL